MKEFTEWLLELLYYMLTLIFVTLMAGAGIGLFFGVACKAFYWVV